MRVSWSLVGLSTSPGTFTGTCGFIHGNTRSYGSPVCRYLVLKTPADPGVEGESARVTCGTHALQRCILTAHYVPRHPLHAPPPMVRVPATHGTCPRCPQYVPTPCAATRPLTCHRPVMPAPCHSTLAADCTAADALRPSQQCRSPTW